MDTDTERTADEIRALTPAGCWDIYVGSQDPVEFAWARDEDRTIEAECAHYVAGSPMCEGLDSAARVALMFRLRDYIEDSLL